MADTEVIKQTTIEAVVETAKTVVLAISERTEDNTKSQIVQQKPTGTEPFQ